MSTESNPTETNRMAIEVTQSDLPLLSTILKQARVNERDDIQSVKVEIRAEKPIFEAEISRDELTPTTSEPDTEPEPETEPETEQTKTAAATLTEKLVDEEPETETETETETDERPTWADIDLSDFDEPTKHEIEEIANIVDLDVGRWKILAILYRSNSIGLKEVDELTDRTPWELGYSHTSACLSKLKDKDLVTKTDQYGGLWKTTEKGIAVMKLFIEQKDEYPLTMADKITGQHPTDPFQTA